jgi:hypothetical protein
MQGTVDKPSYVLRDWRLQINLDQVLRSMGVSLIAQSHSSAVTKLAERALREGLPLVSPLVAYCRHAVVSVGHEQITLRGGGHLTGKLVAKHLAASKKVLLIVATISAKLEERISQVLKHDTTYALALDGFGNAAIEALAVAACHHFAEAAAIHGSYTTMPLSPGMVGWSVEIGQREIFALLDTKAIGLELTSSSLMIPRKSLSMVIGMGTEAMTSVDTCEYCVMRSTCRYREHYQTK